MRKAVNQTFSRLCEARGIVRASGAKGGTRGGHPGRAAAGEFLRLELKTRSAEAEHHEILPLCAKQPAGAGARAASGGHGEGGCGSRARREAVPRETVLEQS